MKLVRIRALVGAIALFTMPIPVSSQEYPTRPITVVVGVAPGGITDVSTRIYVEALPKIAHPMVIRS